MPHIYNLGVVDVLKALTSQPFRDAIAASETELTPEQLEDPVVALRGLIAAVGFWLYILNITTNILCIIAPCLLSAQRSFS